MTFPISEATSPPPADEQDRYQSYKAISAPAVASLGLAVLSLLVFFDKVFVVVPLVAIVLAFVAVRQVRRRSHELTGLPLAMGGIMLAGLILPAGIGWHAFVYATEVPSDSQRISYDVFRPIEEEDFPPPGAMALDGQKVFIKGYMMPSSRSELSEFLLCRDSGECCFGGNPKPYDMVQVKMPGDTRAVHSLWQRKVSGVLRVAKPEEVQQAEGGGKQHRVFFTLEADLFK